MFKLILVITIVWSVSGICASPKRSKDLSRPTLEPSTTTTEVTKRRANVNTIGSIGRRVADGRKQLKITYFKVKLK